MKITIENPNVAEATNQEQLKTNLIESLNIPDLSPLERYAIANQLWKAYKLAAGELSDAAEEYALRNSTEADPNECQPMAGEGKEFFHRGYKYILQQIGDYNYAQDDDNGYIWKCAVKVIAKCKEIIGLMQETRKTLQPKILEAHPRMQAHLDIVLRFISGRTENTDQ